MQSQESSFHLKVDTAGRIVIPSSLRARLHIDPGDTVTLVEEDGDLRIRTRSAAIARIQSYYVGPAKPEKSLHNNNLGSNLDSQNSQKVIH